MNILFLILIATSILNTMPTLAGLQSAAVYAERQLKREEELTNDPSTLFNREAMMLREHHRIVLGVYPPDKATCQDIRDTLVNGYHADYSAATGRTYDGPTYTPLELSEFHHATMCAREEATRNRAILARKMRRLARAKSRVLLSTSI